MEEKAPSTKERLKSIVNDFDNFDSEMKIGTRVIYKFGLIILFIISFDIATPRKR